MSQKSVFSLRVLIAFVLVFSIFIGSFLEHPITLSRKLIPVDLSEPCPAVGELLTNQDAKSSPEEGNTTQDGNDRRNAPVSVVHPSARDEQLQAEKQVPKRDTAIREQEVANGDKEAQPRAKPNSNLEDAEPFREKERKQDSSNWNDQDPSDGVGPVQREQTGTATKGGSFEELPPRLKPRLAHLQPSPTNPLSAPLDWTRPMMLSVIGVPQGDKLFLAMFSAGVNLIGFERSFNVVGCLVGNKTYTISPKDPRHPLKSPHFCLVDPNIPEGATVSLLITRDEKLEEAIAKPFVLNDFTFEVGEEDLLKLHRDVNIDNKVRELSDGYEIVGIKSNITWHEQLREPEFDPTKKRYELCLMTAMRQYPFLMQEWFDYYRRLGVDQIYVYDNVSPEDLSQFDSDFVQTTFWPYGRSQYQSFNHFLYLSRTRCKYLGSLDADEYIFVGDSKPGALKRYIKKRNEEGYDQIIFPFIVMAGGGHIERPEGFLPNLYVRRDLRQRKFHVGKSIVSTGFNLDRHMVHFVVGKTKIYQNRTFELNPTSLDHNGMLMHYTKRSWEEFIMKINTGGASVVSNARAPQNVSAESIPAYYKTNDTTEEYLTFRDHWRSIMKQEEPETVSLVWKKNNKDCQQQFCIACSKKELVGEPVCK